MHDKSFWQDIAKNDYQIPDGETVQSLTPELVEMLASPDPDLRDEISYMVFANWIIKQDRYSAEELRDLIKTLIANFDKNLGESGTESVLLRSFSALTLSLIMYKDASTPFLTDEELREVLDKTLAYFDAEQDVRGYVEPLGWLHSVAHTADVLKFIARNPKAMADDHKRILNAIQAKLIKPIRTVYVHDEDERLVLAVVDVLKRDTLKLEDWQAWLAGFKAWKASQPMPGPFQVTIHAPYMNIKHFVRSLFFAMTALATQNDMAGTLKDEVESLLPVFGAGTIYGG